MVRESGKDRPSIKMKKTYVDTHFASPSSTFFYPCESTQTEELENIKIKL